MFAHPGRLQANGPRHRAEAVADHGVAINAHLAQCGIDGVFAHRPPMAAHARKEAFAAACQRVQVAEGRHGLRGQRDDVRGVGCGGGLAPFVQDRCQDGFGVFQLRRTLGACFGEGHGRVSAQPDHARLACVAVPIAPDARAVGGVLRCTAHCCLRCGRRSLSASLCAAWYRSAWEQADCE